jgi:tRNA pseudouridine32 synthase / 23S rRNA pseudouridine746 synthase
VRGERRYRAKAGDSLTSLLGPDVDALVRAGSVFVSGARVTDANVALEDGVEVVVGQSRVGESCVVLGAISRLIAVDKPASLPSEPDRAGNISARSAVAADLGLDERELHVVGRLDVGVSGVMLFARGDEKMQHAARLRARDAIHRHYVGIALRSPEPKEGRWQDPVDGKPALTDYVTLALAPEVNVNGERARPALVSLKPITGRKHQLRIHAAKANAALLGDRAHGGVQRIASVTGSVIQPTRVALHAHRVSIASERIEAPIPADLRDLWQRLGGSASDWALVGAEALS